MKLHKNEDGYLRAKLTRDAKSKLIMVHRLVLEAFVGPCPDGLEGCHGNGIPDDNRLDNLRWDTHESNMADRDQTGQRNPMSYTWRKRRAA